MASSSHLLVLCAVVALSAHLAAAQDPASSWMGECVHKAAAAFGYRGSTVVQRHSRGSGLHRAYHAAVL